MRKTEVELAALKILLVTLYAQSAAKEGSREKAEEYVREVRELVVGGLIATKTGAPASNHDTIDEIISYVSDFFDFIKFKKDSNV